jgi:hypothetical protein
MAKTVGEVSFELSEDAVSRFKRAFPEQLNEGRLTLTERVVDSIRDLTGSLNYFAWGLEAPKNLLISGAAVGLIISPCVAASSVNVSGNLADFPFMAGELAVTATSAFLSTIHDTLEPCPKRSGLMNFLYGNLAMRVGYYGMLTPFYALASIQ